MSVRHCVTAAGLAGMVVVGAAIRPLLIDDAAPTHPVLNPVEVGLAQDMLAHHSQALTMNSRLDPGADPAVTAIARRIDTSNAARSAS
ncbi:hypothetical protein [Nocardia alba]|uniref:hypothetical protein n=1 Tax=Nocardia alba TaxID=225051 RepID=UPI000AB5064D|nr:hypothetical protein [Nocardia alba]